MRDEELVLRFFAFYTRGIDSYRTPQKHWLNETAKTGRTYSDEETQNLYQVWSSAIDTSLVWFSPRECFRRIPLGKSRAINRALFDLVMLTAARVEIKTASGLRDDVRHQYKELLQIEEFQDLISRSMDHTKRTKRRFEMWEERIGELFG
jgi:hypothetical protein